MRMQHALSIGVMTMSAWVAMNAVPAVIDTVGGINITPSAWAQPADRPDADRPPPPNPNQGFLGAKFGPITDEIADEMKLDTQNGVIVMELVPDSPAAAENGLKVNDIIMKMDDKTVEDVQGFVTVMRGTKVGQVMKFTVIRAGKNEEISITLGKRPAGMNQPPATQPREKKD